MSKFEDFAAVWADALPRNPFDPEAVSESARKSAETGEALTAVVLKAAGSCADLTEKWALESLGRAKDVVSAGADPAGFAAAAKESASAAFESAAEHIGAYTEIAKRAQIESVEIVLGAAK